MRDDERGAVFCQLVECVLDLRFCQRVKRAGRLVQNEDGRIFEKDPRDGDALLLPAGEQRAAFADVGVEAVGHGHDVVVDLGPLRRLDDLVHLGVGLAVADVLKDGIGEQEDLLLHDADRAAQALLRHAAHVQPVDGDAAGRDVVKAWDELAERALAAAGRTDDGDGLPGRDLQRHIVQHGQIAFVAEAHVVHADLAARTAEVDGVRRVAKLRLRAHDLQKALKARRAVGVQLGEVGELADGRDEGGNIERERQQVDGVHLPLHDEQTAHRDDRDGQRGRKELHRAHKNAHFLVELLLGGLVGVVRAGEFLGLHRLVGEGLGRADAGKRGFDVGVDDRRLFLDAAGGRPHGLAAREAHKDEHRDHHGHDQRQPPFDRRHDGQRADDGHERDEQVLRPVVGKLGDLKQIRRHPAHELAGAVAVKKLEAQLLHMPEERRADIGLHADAERMAPVGDDKVEQRAQRVRRHHDQHHREKRAVGVLRQQRPHRVARDDRVSQIDQRHDQRAGQVEKKQAPVRPEKGEKDGKSGPRPVLLCRHDRCSVSA